MCAHCRLRAYVLAQTLRPRGTAVHIASDTILEQVVLARVAGWATARVCGLLDNKP